MFSAEKGSKLFERSEFLIPLQKIFHEGSRRPSCRAAFSFGSFSLGEQRK